MLFEGNLIYKWGTYLLIKFTRKQEFIRCTEVTKRIYGKGRVKKIHASRKVDIWKLLLLERNLFPKWKHQSYTLICRQNNIHIFFWEEQITIRVAQIDLTIKI